MYMRFSIFVIIILLLGISVLQESFSATKTIDDDWIVTTITYPEGIVRGSDFNISFLIKNTGSNERTNATMKMNYQMEVFQLKSEEGYSFEKISSGSSYGRTFSVKNLPNSTLGQHFINIDFSHIDSDNDLHGISVALPITIREEPKVLIKTNVQDSIYSNAEFPFEVEIESQGSDIRDVTIKIIPPNEVTFRGQTSHTFSFIEKDIPVTLRADLATADEKTIGYEHYISFQVIVEYTDDTNTERTTSKTNSSPSFL